MTTPGAPSARSGWTRRAFGVFVCVAGAATAAEAEEWRFRVSPYVWGPTLDTTVNVRDAPETSGSSSIFDILEGALLLSGEARRGRFSLLGEVNYLDLGDDTASAQGAANARVDIEGVLASLAGGWTVMEVGGGRVDVFAGARLWTLDTSVDFANLPKASREKTWVDPLIGLRGVFAATDAIAIEAFGDIGGFGVGSDLQWELVARAGWRINERFTAAAGWRHLDVRFDDGGLDLDLQLSGPFVALDVTF